MYKNKYVFVEGEKVLLEAFSKKLIELGVRGAFKPTGNISTGLKTYSYEDHIVHQSVSDMARYESIQFKLPQDWNKAIEAIFEKEIDVHAELAKHSLKIGDIVNFSGLQGVDENGISRNIKGSTGSLSELDRKIKKIIVANGEPYIQIECDTASYYKASEVTKEEEIAVGDWIADGYTFMKVQEISASHYIGRGETEYYLGSTSIPKSAARKITITELEQLLIAEAKKRRFVGTIWNVQLYGINGTPIPNQAVSCVDYTMGRVLNCSVLNVGGGYIWDEKNGWAIIQPSTPKILIKNYEAEKSRGCIKFGCQLISREELLAVKHLLNDEIRASISIGGQAITVELVDSLIKMLE